MLYRDNDSIISMFFSIEEFNVLFKLISEHLPNSDLYNQFYYMSINGFYKKDDND